MSSIKRYYYFLLLISLSSYSQEVFQGEFKNTPATFKSINEPLGNRTFVQLILFNDSTYKYEGYVYNEENKSKDCFLKKGKWKIEDDVLYLYTDSKFDYNKEIKYRFIRNKVLKVLGASKVYARKTKLNRVKTVLDLNCDNSGNSSNW